MRTWAGSPDLLVEVEAIPAAPALTDALLAARVRQAVLQPTQCELVFRDLSEDLLEQLGSSRGRAMRLAVRGQTPALFAGEVSAVELVCGASGARELRVRGYDPLQRLRERQPVRMFSETSAPGMARQLAADCGLTVEAAEEGPAWPRVMQWRETDFELLVEAVTRAGLLFAVRDDTLELFTPEGLDVTRVLTLGDSLLEARFEASLRPAPSGIRTVTWDPLTGRRAEGESAPPRRPPSAPPGWTAAGGDGAQPRTVVNAASPSLAHAAGQAQLAADRAASAAAVLWGVAEGDPGLRPGVRAVVRGGIGPFAGSYVITEAVHTVDADRGYLTELSSHPPEPSRRSGGAVVAPGVVTRVDDPDGIGRVQASLPSYPSLSTGWMRVVLPAAGPDKGFVALPDVGDEVLVLLPDGDPALGLVIGGLYGAVPPPDDGVGGGAVRRHTWRTAGGQLIQLDDGGRRVLLANAEGTTLTLGPDAAKLHAETDLAISAPGRRITIEAAAVDFRKA